MSEPQQIEGQEVDERSAGTTDPEHATVRPVIEIAGGSWVLVPLEDGESWNLRPADAPDGPRLAHITVSERGYFSIDRPGVVRGPYVTLSEAAYPLARHDRVLLDDTVDRSGVEAPTRSENRSGDGGTSWRRDLLLVFAAIGAVVLGLRLAGGGARPMRVRAEGSR